MATDRRQQQRALDAAEFSRVETTMHPAIARLSDAELGETIAWLRERRDRARSLANRQRRAVRGKGERGAGAAGFDQADAGNREKARVLSEAVSRAGKERTRRAQKASRARLVESAQAALIRKAEKPAPRRPKSGRTAGEGMHRWIGKRPSRRGNARSPDRACSAGCRWSATAPLPPRCGRRDRRRLGRGCQLGE